MSTVPSSSRELVVLVADLDAEFAVRGVLSRSRSLTIRKLTEGVDFDIHRHIQRDPGCLGSADSFLRSFVRTHRHALVVFDHHGCGQEHFQDAAEIEAEVKARMDRAGWMNRCDVVVVKPELEAWIWSDSPHVASELGWRGKGRALSTWLESKGLWASGQAKPKDPKKAMSEAMRCAGKPISPGVFGSLASKVSLSRCQDRAFLKLKTILQQWFKEGC